MHVLVVTVEIDPDRFEEATEGLHSIVIPEVKGAPGFVSGTWGHSTDRTKGTGFIVFESEDAANTGAEMARQGTPEGVPVTFVSAEVLEVTAQA
jgi:hypothetical protein